MNPYKKGDRIDIDDEHRVVVTAYHLHEDAQKRCVRERKKPKGLRGLGITRRGQWSIVHKPYDPLYCGLND